MPRAACLQSNSKANTGETGKNSSCNLILSIYLLPQGVTGDSGTCVLQQFLEVGRLYNSLQGNIAGDLSRRPTIWRGLLPCVSVKIWGPKEWTEWLPWFMLPRVPLHLPKTKHLPQPPDCPPRQGLSLLPPRSWLGDCEGTSELQQSHLFREKHSSIRWANKGSEYQLLSLDLGSCFIRGKLSVCVCRRHMPTQGERKSGCKRKGNWMLKKWSIYLKITGGIYSI